MQVRNLVAIVAGLIVLAASAAAWKGYWRGWTRTFITAHLPLPVTLLPVFGLLLIAFPLNDTNVPGGRILAGIALVLVPFAVVLMLWNPGWWGPRWFREMKSSGKEVAQT